MGKNQQASTQLIFIGFIFFEITKQRNWMEQIGVNPYISSGKQTVGYEK